MICSRCLRALCSRVSAQTCSESHFVCARSCRLSTPVRPCHPAPCHLTSPFLSPFISHPAPTQTCPSHPSSSHLKATRSSLAGLRTFRTLSSYSMQCSKVCTLCRHPYPRCSSISNLQATPAHAILASTTATARLPLRPAFGAGSAQAPRAAKSAGGLVCILLLFVSRYYG